MYTILSTRFTHVDDDLLLTEMKERIFSRRQTSCYYANFSQVLLNEQDEAFRRHFERADIVVPDGFALAIAGRVLNGTPTRLKTVTNTTDLFDRILAVAAAEKYRVFFLGGKPEWAIALRERVLRKFPGLQIAGIHHGYIGSMHAPVIDAINDSAADIVMVGMGSPLQETWLAQHRDQMHPPFVMTVGAYISFLSDELPRAPQILRTLRLEWFYRLCLEPGRLWKRYLVGGLAFAWSVVRARMRKK